MLPLFAFPEMMRHVVSTTHAIESVKSTLRKVTQAHNIFPSDEAFYKVSGSAIHHQAVDGADE